MLFYHSHTKGFSIYQQEHYQFSRSIQSILINLVFEFWWCNWVFDVASHYCIGLSNLPACSLLIIWIHIHLANPCRFTRPFGGWAIMERWPWRGTYVGAIVAVSGASTVGSWPKLSRRNTSNMLQNQPKRTPTRQANKPTMALVFWKAPRFLVPHL